MTESTDTAATPAAAATEKRTALATIVLAVAGISFIGLAGSLIGHFLDWRGFDDGTDSTAAANTLWLMFFFGGIAALVTGLVALVKSWRNGPASERSAGRMGVAYVVLAVLLIVIVDSID